MRRSWKPLTVKGPGVRIPVSPDTSFIPVTHITDAGAFAVSLEPAGGSPAPTEVVMLGETGE